MPCLILHLSRCRLNLGPSRNRRRHQIHLRDRNLSRCQSLENRSHVTEHKCRPRAFDGAALLWNAITTISWARFPNTALNESIRLHPAHITDGFGARDASCSMNRLRRRSWISPSSPGQLIFLALPSWCCLVSLLLCPLSYRLMSQAAFGADGIVHVLP